MYRVSSFVPRFAKALFGGAVLATAWVNLAPASYFDSIEWRLLDLGLPGAGLVWVLVGSLIETAEEAGLAADWQVPLGTDVVLCFLVGRAAFGPWHPALHLLLLLTIATDVLALMVAGLLFWIGVAASGLPPVLGLFAEIGEFLNDPLNRLSPALAWPLTGILFLFGLPRGGIDRSAFAPTTVTTLAALWLGRPPGMLVLGLGLGLAAARGLRLPSGVTLRDILRIALIMAMGLTVPVLSLETALPGGAMQEAARLGLALSLLAGPLALLLRPAKAPDTSA